MSMSPRLLRPRATGFDPRSIANLSAWFDANQQNTLFDADTGGNAIADDTAVGRWEDRSGNSRHVVQDTANNRPKWKTNQRNGLPGLDFDGSNDFLIGLHDAWAGSVSMFAVASFFNNTTRYALLDVGTNASDPTGSGAAHLAFEQNTFSTVGQRYGIYSTTSTFDSDAATSTGAHLFSYHAAAGDSLTTGVVYRVDRSTRTLTRRAGSANTFGQALVCNYSAVSKRITIGGFNNGTNAANLVVRGIAHEFLIYSRKLSASEYTAVENYLAGKWGLS